MKNMQFIMPLFAPDIIEFIAGRDILCQLVLKECKSKSGRADDAISIKTQLFTELNFSTGDIVEIMVAMERLVKIKFSYRLLLQQDRSITVEDLGTLLWKFMCKTVRNN
jgi:hypothetical protein